jgi:molybdopterin biosynthesis enzyme
LVLLGIDAKVLKEAFSLAAQQADVIITSGGVSVEEQTLLNK